MINSKPAGILSLLGLKSGLDAPRDLGAILQLTLESLPFYIASVLKLDESATAVGSSGDNILIYPVLAATPQGEIRYIERAGVHLQWTAGAAIVLSGWIVTRSSGSTYALSAAVNGTVTSSSVAVQPYCRLKGLILQPGERLGCAVTSGALSAGQLNFGIRYADFIL